MIRLLAPFFLILLIGCNSSKEDTFTYFGGKIINPKGRYVVLSDQNGVIDSVKLENDDTFLGKFKNLKEGLYYFEHGVESQFVYLQPSDSLLLRLNVWDFDESLVFSGPNSARNNFLIDAFLTREKERKTFYLHQRLNPKEFKQKIDSTLQVKNEQLESFIQINDEKSTDFVEIAKIALNYPIYSEIESYRINNSVKKSDIKLDSSFLEHRKFTDLNKNSLVFYSPYIGYVLESLYSDVYQQKIKKNSDDFTIALINNIDSKISSEKFKNRLLKNRLLRHFLRKSTCNLNKKTFNRYYELSTNKNDIDDIKMLVKDVETIKKYKVLPDFSLYDFTNKEYNIKELIKDKSSVLYFRNKKYSSDEWVASKINFLMKKYPNIQFLVINIDKNQSVNRKLSSKNQFYLTKESKAQQFLESKFPRTILVNKDEAIENGFASLSSPIIHQQITNLEK